MEENENLPEKETKLDPASEIDKIRNGLFKNAFKSVIGENTIKKDEEEGDDRDIDDMFGELFKDSEDQPTE